MQVYHVLFTRAFHAKDDVLIKFRRIEFLLQVKTLRAFNVVICIAQSPEVGVHLSLLSISL